MLGEVGHHRASHLVRTEEGTPPVRGGYCMILVAAWVLFLAVVVGWILGLKGVG
jgi:hypothetical protein